MWIKNIKCDFSIQFCFCLCIILRLFRLWITNLVFNWGYFPIFRGGLRLMTTQCRMFMQNVFFPICRLQVEMKSWFTPFRIWNLDLEHKKKRTQILVKCLIPSSQWTWTHSIYFSSCAMNCHFCDLSAELQCSTRSPTSCALIESKHTLSFACWIKPLLFNVQSWFFEFSSHALRTTREPLENLSSVRQTSKCRMSPDRVYVHSWLPPPSWHGYRPTTPSVLFLPIVSKQR